MKKIVLALALFLCYLNATCEQGDVKICNEMIVKYSASNSDKLKHYAQISCDLMDRFGCLSLGNYHQEKEEFTLAGKAFEIACKKDQKQACSALAWLYQYGMGVKTDYKRAYALFGKSCDLGYLRGCSRLAFMLHEGLAGDKNSKKALEIYEFSCEGGDFEGCMGASALFLQEDNLNKSLYYAKKLCDLGECEFFQKLNEELAR